MEYIVRIALIGIGATLVSDAWGRLRAPLTGAPAPDYSLVGRWLGHMALGRFRHVRIAAAARIPAERLLGYGFHYGVGVVFAFIAVALAGQGWLDRPTPLPALLVGLGTVLAPFVVMQPAMGAGWFARRAPNPWLARVHSVLLHLAFGLGLYLSALIAAPIPHFHH